MFRDFFFFFVTTDMGREYYWHLISREARKAVKHPTMHRPALQQKINGSNINGVEANNTSSTG